MRTWDQSPTSAEHALFEQMRPLFIALGDADRQDILLHLTGHVRLNVGELTSLTELSRPTVSYHLKVLKDVGLVYEEKEGVKRYYQPTFSRYIEPMRRLIDCAEKIERNGGRYGR